MKRLNNKGFTLIELLAVIVILAIVMGVAANAVLNVMNDSRKNTLQSSAKSAADAFRTAYAETQLKSSDKIFGLTLSDLVKDDNSSQTLSLEDADTSKMNLSDSNYDLEHSYVNYDNGTFKVCLKAATNGSYYLSGSTGTDAGIHTYTAGDMWACSDDRHSW